MSTDDTIDLGYYKGKLEEEMENLIAELQTIGRINPDTPGDWEAVAANLDQPHSADLNEEADDIEEYGEHVAILEQLEIRFNEVKDAIERIEEDAYGICSVCGKKIEEDRLEANPAAKTCKSDIEETV
ncbi:MAG: TraR/DksA C4-type zinc finger protein [Candidatus Paceibacterota bacterium]